MSDYTHNIAANIHRPDKESTSLAVLLPGMLMSKDYTNFTSLADTLKDNNITAVRFDPTGSWESEVDIDHYSITQYLADIDYVLSYLNSNNEFDRVILIGHSLGGMVGQIFADKFDTIDTVISIFSPGRFGISEFTKSVMPNWEKEGKLNLNRKSPFDLNIELKLELPYEFVEDAMDYDGFESAANSSCKKLFIGSNSDKTVSLEQVKDFYAKAKQPKKLIELDDVPHIYWKSSESLDKVNNAILNYINTLN